MQNSYRNRARRIWRDALWVYRQTAAANPGLFRLYLLNTLVSIIYPAGLAWSVRGLVNTVDAGLKQGAMDSQALNGWLLFGFVMALGSALSFSVATYLANRFQLELRPLIGKQILRQQARAPYALFEQEEFRNSLHRAQETPEIAVAQACTFSLDLIVKSLQITSLVIILILIEPLLFALLVPIGLPYLLFRWRMTRRQFEEVDKKVKSQRIMRYYRGLLSNLEQFGEIKVLGLGPELRRRYFEIMDEFRRLVVSFENWVLAGKSVFNILSVAAVYLALGFAAVRIVDGGLTIGDLAIFASAAAQLRSLFEQSVNLISSSRWQLLQVRRLREFLDMEIPGEAGLRETPRITKGILSLRNVSFSYPEAHEKAIKDLSFDIAPGEIVALVGRNGAGKSTVAKLVCGFYRPQGGEIRIDEHSLQELDPVAVGRLVGLIPQRFGRYAVTAAENIAYGDWARLKDNQQGIESVARKAGVDSLIEAMPSGYETVLGREFGGHELSGGQWQQLAIARMMARETPVLVLDEPSANLDAEAEYELNSKLRHLASGRATLLISHRFSSVSVADRILVLDKGILVEDGTHEELLAAGGYYANLYRLAVSGNGE